MKPHDFRYAFALFALVNIFLLSSCDVEFSPNAQWKEVPVVYCLLDQDDSISYVRVEKCYLSEGDIYAPARISDSVNYPQGSIDVSILAFDSLGGLRDSLPFVYAEIDHDEGDFAYTAQPIYYCVTAGRLRDDWRYQLRVRHTDDNRIIASTPSIPLIKQVSQAVVNKPSYTEFNGRPSGQFAFNSAGNTCLIEWDTMRFGRLYQPVIRFYYSVNGDTTYVDLHSAPSKASRGTANTISVSYNREAFLKELKTKLHDDTATKKYLKMVDIYLTVASEDYNAYRTSLQAGASLSQGREPYTNINGGLGVFASRRTHLYKWMPSDSSNLANGLYTHLRNLGVGIE